MSNVEKADAVMKQLNAIEGVYTKPIKSLCSSIKHMPRENKYRVVLDLDAEQLGGGRCIRQVLECGENLNLVPIVVLIDPSEVKA